MLHLALLIAFAPAPFPKPQRVDPAVGVWGNGHHEVTLSRGGGFKYTYTYAHAGGTSTVATAGTWEYLPGGKDLIKFSHGQPGETPTYRTEYAVLRGGRLWFKENHLLKEKR